MREKTRAGDIGALSVRLHAIAHADIRNERTDPLFVVPTLPVDGCDPFQPIARRRTEGKEGLEVAIVDELLSQTVHGVPFRREAGTPLQVLSRRIDMVEIQADQPRTTLDAVSPTIGKLPAERGKGEMAGLVGPPGLEVGE